MLAEFDFCPGNPVRLTHFGFSDGRWTLAYCLQYCNKMTNISSELFEKTVKSQPFSIKTIDENGECLLYSSCLFQKLNISISANDLARVSIVFSSDQPEKVATPDLGLSPSRLFTGSDVFVRVLNDEGVESDGARMASLSLVVNANSKTISGKIKGIDWSKDFDKDRSFSTMIYGCQGKSRMTVGYKVNDTEHPLFDINGVFMSIDEVAISPDCVRTDASFATLKGF